MDACVPVSCVCVSVRVVFCKCLCLRRGVCEWNCVVSVWGGGGLDRYDGGASLPLPFRRRRGRHGGGGGAVDIQERITLSILVAKRDFYIKNVSWILIVWPMIPCHLLLLPGRGSGKFNGASGEMGDTEKVVFHLKRQLFEPQVVWKAVKNLFGRCGEVLTKCPSVLSLAQTH